jgi:hypothetical protein
LLVDVVKGDGWAAPIVFVPRTLRRTLIGTRPISFGPIDPSDFLQPTSSGLFPSVDFLRSLCLGRFHLVDLLCLVRFLDRRTKNEEPERWFRLLV